jgi:sugar transferase (PEP-CTERM/EpsH1 system associated)
VRILFLTHRLPYAPNRGDRVRAYHILRDLTRWAKVDLLSLVHDDEEASHAEDLRSRVSTLTIARVPRTRNIVRSLISLPTLRPTTHTMLDAPGLAALARKTATAHTPDVVLAYCSGMARLGLDDAAGLRRLPFVLDMVDVDSAKWEALAATTSGPRSWVYTREAQLLRRFEAAAARHAYATLVVTPKERETMESIAPGSRIEVVQNGVDVDEFRPSSEAAGAPVVVFCGVMDYTPNVEGARWLARDVWPSVRARRSDARLQLVGSRPAPAVQSLADPDSGVELTGEVPDVRPYLWRAAVACAPLLTARGIQNKVLEAVAAGLPVVVTPVVSEGLPPEVMRACVIAGDAAAFADRIVELLERSPTERRQLAARADLDRLTWKRRLEPLRPLLQAAAERGDRDYG